MTIMLSAEMRSNGLWNYNEGIEIELSQTPLSEETVTAIKKWVEEYLPYSAAQNSQNKEVLENIKRLDERGITLLNRIAVEWTDSQIEKFYYYSVGEDKIKYTVYPH